MARGRKRGTTLGTKLMLVLTAAVLAATAYILARLAAG